MVPTEKGEGGPRRKERGGENLSKRERKKAEPPRPKSELGRRGQLKTDFCRRRGRGVKGENKEEAGREVINLQQKKAKETPITA